LTRWWCKADTGCFLPGKLLLLLLLLLVVVVVVVVYVGVVRFCC
jgi:hypothetical protein